MGGTGAKWVINKNLIFSIFFKEERVCGLMTSLSSQLKNLGLRKELRTS